MTGLRPIAELMFSDFFAVAWDMVANQIAKTRYMTDGQVSLPLVLRTANGGGLRFGAQHSQSVENWAMAIPGLKVVAPVHAGRHGGADGRRHPRPRPGDLLRAQGAVRRRRARCPTASTSCRSGRPRSSAQGTDATVVALAAMVPRALEAAERLAAEDGIDAEVVDLRSPRAAGRRDGARVGREDDPPVHRRGEPAAVRLGRGGRRRSSRTRRSTASTRPIVRITTPHIPLAVGRGARGRAMPSAERIVDDRPAHASRRRAMTGLTVVAVARAPGGWARRWPARWRAAGFGPDPLQPHARTGARRWPTSSAHASSTPAAAAAAGRRRHHDARRRRGGARRCTRGPDGLLEGASARARCCVDMSTVPPTVDPVASSPPRAAAARASSTRRCRAASPRPRPGS